MDPSEWGVEIEAHLEYRRTTWVQLSHTEHIFQGPLLISLLAVIRLSQRRPKYMPSLQGTQPSEKAGDIIQNGLQEQKQNPPATPQREIKEYRCPLLSKSGVDEKLCA